LCRIWEVSPSLARRGRRLPQPYVLLPVGVGLAVLDVPGDKQVVVEDPD
jgi:hypothetical protein